MGRPQGRRGFRGREILDFLGGFSRGIAHDFNNIITAVVQFSQFLDEDLPADHPNREDVRELQRAAARATTLCRELMRFSQPSSVDGPGVDLHGLLKVLEPILRIVLGPGVEMTLGCEETLCPAEIDAEGLREALVALAFEASDTLEPHNKIHFVLSNDGNLRLRLCVRLPTAAPENLGADAFSRLIASAACTFERAGDELVLTFPYSSEPAQHEPPRVSRGHERILVVDDDVLTRTSIVQSLRRLGYDVVESCDGREARRWLQQDSVGIDLMLADVPMPHLGGAVLAKEAGDRVGGVLFMSGHPTAVCTLEPLLKKPFSPHELAYAVRRQLDMKQGAKGGKVESSIRPHAP